MKMTELKERFSLADEIGTRDLWGEARRRAVAPEAPPRTVDWPPALGRRLAAGAVALAVFATASVFAWDLSHSDRGFGPSPMPTVDLVSELPEGWSELPAPPEVRSGAATAWTGSELLVWGGYEYGGSGDEARVDDGFAFDAASRTWERLPASPLEARSEPAFAWTGEELLIWGGFDGGFREVPYFDDGAAFDPLTGRWRMLPAPPVGPRTPFSVWTGKELIVWGSADRFARLRDGAAYDPVTNRWRTIADGPTDITDGSAVWTGEEMIVFGAALDGNNHADTPTAIGAAYDPVLDTWRELPPSDLSPQAMTAEWVNGELIAWDYEHATATYDPGMDVWRPLPNVPLSFAECGPESVATAQLILGNYCGQTVMFSTPEDAWHRQPIPGLEGGVLEPVVAGNVVLVPWHSFGMGIGPPDRRMFAYNPPAVVRTDARGEVLEPEPFIPQGAERDGAEIRLPVIFPDGSQATLVYPIPLDLATLGFQPDVSYVWRADPPPRYPVVFLHDRNASIVKYVEGREPVGSVNSYRNIEIWNMSETWLEHRAQLRGGWLRIGLRSWTVLIALREVADADRIAANLDIRETTTGFPVVDATGPIQLAEGFGESEGPTLSLGDETAEPDTVSQLDATIFLSPDGCTPATNSEWSGGYGSACLGDGSVFASIYGDREFVTSVTEGLRVEDFRRA
jgi:hypothetical protein